MRVLAVNLGSSSLRLSVVADGDRVDADAHAADDVDPIHRLREFAARVGNVDAVAHRLVHGGPSVRAATVVDDALRRRLDEAAAMAPLHVPPALRLLDNARASIDGPHVVCVDTAFHAAMPKAATTYAIPQQPGRRGARAGAAQGSGQASGHHRDLGNVRVLFTDKTGTLTAGSISFTAAIDPLGVANPDVLVLGLLCNEATLVDGVPTSGNPLDQALWAAPASAGLLADGGRLRASQRLGPCPSTTSASWPPSWPGRATALRC